MENIDSQKKMSAVERFPLQRVVRYKEMNVNRKLQFVPKNGVGFREVSATKHVRCRELPL